jgi:SAM-dependent methyltransferase
MSTADRATKRVERVGHEWDVLAEQDALWVILSNDPERRGRWGLEEFFATGEREVAKVIERADRLGRPVRRERALDFGCGVGRLTRALAGRFGECVGVDVSAEMIARARELNGDHPNCTFEVNVAPDLALFPDDGFDFVYSSKVLQHMPSRTLACAYVQEFVRVARPDGLVVLQLWTRIPPQRRVQPRRRLYALLRALHVPERVLLRRGLSPRGRAVAVPERELRRVVEEAGGRVAATEPDGEWGLVYYVLPAA